MKNARAFISDTDLAGDNVETNPDSTENNSVYDEDEVFNDYGLDNCPDELEYGLDSCVVSSNNSPFNSSGTEGNNHLDWTDYNGNGKWDELEGEMWWDWGSDWCPDSLENGAGPCRADTVPCNCLDAPGEITLGYDPNRDNADPTGDDWDEINNPFGTEGNNQWDSGEPFNDWGSDGLPISLVGDPDENGSEVNASYDIGEPFEDTGSDGLFNVDESGYNINRTEGDNKIDLRGEFKDCGEDNICGEPDNESNDDYNIDPNNDNWNDCGSDRICPNDDDYILEDADGTEGNEEWNENEGTEGNGLLDLINSNSNGLWGNGDGEQWFDWGLDGIPDSQEAFQTSFSIPLNLYSNSYIFNISEEELQESPELVSDTVSLWISEIQKTGTMLTIEVSIQTNVALKGLQFQLFHTPYTRVETKLQTYEIAIVQIGTEKLFEDLTLHPKKHYSKEELEGKLLIDFANDVSTFLDFDSLGLFLANSEYILSHQYSNLVMYVDSALTDIQDDYIYVNIAHTNSSGEDVILLQEPVSALSDSIEIKIGQILRRYQNGNIDAFNGLKFMIDGNRNNYSKLSIQYNSEESDHNPRLEIMYTK